MTDGTIATFTPTVSKPTMIRSFRDDSSTSGWSSSVKTPALKKTDSGRIVILSRGDTFELVKLISDWTDNEDNQSVVSRVQQATFSSDNSTVASMVMSESITRRARTKQPIRSPADAKVAKPTVSFKDPPDTTWHVPPTIPEMESVDGSGFMEDDIVRKHSFSDVRLEEEEEGDDDEEHIDHIHQDDSDANGSEEDDKYTVNEEESNQEDEERDDVTRTSAYDDDNTRITADDDDDDITRYSIDDQVGESNRVVRLNHHKRKKQQQRRQDDETTMNSAVVPFVHFGSGLGTMYELVQVNVDTLEFFWGRGWVTYDAP